VVAIGLQVGAHAAAIVGRRARTHDGVAPQIERHIDDDFIRAVSIGDVGERDAVGRDLARSARTYDQRHDGRHPSKANVHRRLLTARKSARSGVPSLRCASAFVKRTQPNRPVR
jgi:hypothetical protein